MAFLGESGAFYGRELGTDGRFISDMVHYIALDDQVATIGRRAGYLRHSVFVFL